MLPCCEAVVDAVLGAVAGAAGEESATWEGLLEGADAAGVDGGDGLCGEGEGFSLVCGAEGVKTGLGAVMVLVLECWEDFVLV